MGGPKLKSKQPYYLSKWRYRNIQKYQTFSTRLQSNAKDSRGVVGDVFLLAGRQVHEVPLLRVEQLEEEAALVRVAQVPRHVERRTRLQRRPHVA